MRPVPLLLSLLAASGCKPASWAVIDGSLVNQEPYFQSAFWVRMPGGDPNTIWVQLDSFPDGCATWTELANAGYAYQTSYTNTQAAASAWLQLLPDFFWQARVMFLSPFENEADLDAPSFLLDTTPTVDVSDPSAASVELFGWIGLPTETYFKDPGKPYVDRVDWRGRPGGSLVVVRPGGDGTGPMDGALSITLQTEGDGATAVESSMAIAFTAERCEALEGLVPNAL